jgi:outer membrane protein TolC
MNVLEVDRKLKFQELLPIVNLRANVLNRGYEVWKGTNTAGFYENNNKFGIDIGVPLRFSKGRAAYKIARLKIQETGFEISMTQQQIENKVNYYFNELAGYQQQVRIYENAYKNYQTLLRGEEIRFRGGESSLFLLNNRENKVIEAGIKLTEIKIKFYQSQVALQAAAGLLR